MKNVRIGIIGVGSMGRKYVRLIAEGYVPGLELTVICTRSEATRRWLRESYGDSGYLFADAEEFFARPELYDAVLVVTPHALHPALCIRALGLGKPVFCDKPTGVAVSESLAMEDAARAAQLPAAVMFHNRMRPVLCALKKKLEDGELGTLTRASYRCSRYFRTGHYHASAPWRSSWQGEGGGALINQGQHPLDLWAWLFGMPQTLSADVHFGKYNDFAVDDEVLVTMEYANGLFGTFFLTTVEPDGGETLEIVGTKGRVVLSGDTLTVTSWPDSAEYRRTAAVSDERELPIETNTEVYPEAPAEKLYIEMLANFAQAVSGGAPLTADFADGTNALALCNAAYLSACRQKPVALPLDAAAYDALLARLRAEEAGQKGE